MLVKAVMLETMPKSNVTHEIGNVVLCILNGSSALRKPKLDTAAKIASTIKRAKSSSRIKSTSVKKRQKKKMPSISNSRSGRRGAMLTTEKAEETVEAHLREYSPQDFHNRSVQHDWKFKISNALLTHTIEGIAEPKTRAAVIKKINKLRQILGMPLQARKMFKSVILRRGRL